ncbi:phage tail protein [Pedobacter soli]|uniref:Microcystin-dependent protein n=1 Tax=Pedobacter soli TaxID=390242 RepID=A0A1G6JT08_9SPHI|nr:tail fiber protein [Pedobacter soli]SDC21833.1 Microcystin-dependent protein [Pedobacter soli]
MYEPFISFIGLFGLSFNPRGWQKCYGQIMSIAQNTALFSLLGTTYGGNGQSTFALPDLRGRAPIGDGQGPGLSPYVLGQIGGVENVTLISTQMPQHNHLVLANTDPGTTGVPAGNYLSASPKTGSGPNATVLNTYTTTANTQLNPSSIGFAGGNQPHVNMQPYLTLTYCIATEGIFPSRN